MNHSTTEIFFDNLRVPVENLIGEENGGFRPIAVNFNDERLNMAAGAIATAQVASEEALAWEDLARDPHRANAWWRGEKAFS